MAPLGMQEHRVIAIFYLIIQPFSSPLKEKDDGEDITRFI